MLRRIIIFSAACHRQTLRVLFISLALIAFSQLTPQSITAASTSPPGSNSSTVLSISAKQRVGAGVNLSAFHLLSPNEGWILLNEQLYWTNNGGQTWTTITPQPLLLEAGGIRAVFFLDTRRGWVVTTDSSGGLAIARTVDAGTTWQTRALVLQLPWTLSSAPAASVASVHLYFVDAETGWLVVRRPSSSNFDIGALYKTTDGGASWSPLTIPIGDPVYFATPDLGWTVGGAAGNEIYATRDGGRTWVQPVIGADKGGTRLPLQPKFSNARDGVLPIIVAAGDDTRIDLYRTRDGGESWKLGTRIPYGDDIAPRTRVPIAIPDLDQPIVISPRRQQVATRAPNGSIAMTSSRDPLVAGIRELDMANSIIGWGKYVQGTCEGGDKNRCTQITQLVRTTDGGQTWQPLVIPPTSLASSASPIVRGGGGIASPSSLVATVTGQGFDACGAPTLNQFLIWWLDSPYLAYNVYLGGSAMASCSQFTASSLAQVAAQGWKFFPTWVGPQAPCNNFISKISTDTTVAYDQGVAEANSAITAAYNLGLTDANKTGTVLYYDLEAYDSTNLTCRAAVDSFVRGWSGRVKLSGNVAGMYGGCYSAVSDWANTDVDHIPDMLWLAHWVYSGYNASATVWDTQCLDDTLWMNHQRLRQYAGGHYESWGGVTRNIDSDVLDGVLASLSNLAKPSYKYYFPIISK